MTVCMTVARNSDGVFVQWAHTQTRAHFHTQIHTHTYTPLHINVSTHTHTRTYRKYTVRYTRHTYPSS
eukprot:m.780096 g.780096  ORF g.780096 m.780096 type:complete len:68 (+) comp23280_c2_seq6:163-366(+)